MIGGKLLCSLSLSDDYNQWGVGSIKEAEINHACQKFGTSFMGPRHTHTHTYIYIYIYSRTLG
jgi:hypothetical protein